MVVSSADMQDVETLLKAGFERFSNGFFVVLIAVVCDEFAERINLVYLNRLPAEDPGRRSVRREDAQEEEMDEDETDDDNNEEGDKDAERTIDGSVSCEVQNDSVELEESDTTVSSSLHEDCSLIRGRWRAQSERRRCFLECAIGDWNDGRERRTESENVYVGTEEIERAGERERGREHSLTNNNQC